MLKFKVVYGKQSDYDFDDPLTEQIVLYTPNNVTPDNIGEMIGNIYDLVSYKIYIYNYKSKCYYDTKDLDINWKPIMIQDIVKTSKILKDYDNKNFDVEVEM